MTERTTPEQRVERAKARAAATARRSGGDEAATAAAVAQAEKLHSDPRTQAVYQRMEDEAMAREEAEELAATQLRNRQEREFNEALERHRLDRLAFYRLTRPGLSEAAFNRDLWPRLRAAYVADEPDAVDEERRSRSAPVF